MFARRPSATTSAPKAGAATPDWMATLSNPYYGAGGAGVLILAAAAALILIAGDPNAGAPSVRIALDNGADGARHVLRPSLPLGPDGAVTLDTLQPGQEVAVPDAGQAFITLPQGATFAGAAATGGVAAAGATPQTVSAADLRPQSAPLVAAPVAGLAAPGPGGMLPIIAKDGRTPFQAYQRPFRDSGKPKIALVIGGLGLNAAATKAAIERLPPEVTLSFVPYAEGLQAFVDRARAYGHEVMLEIPMEPLDYPTNDPGPYTLLANAPAPETTRRLDWLLGRVAGYFAVTNYLGGRFVNAAPAMASFTNALKSRGLGFVDDGSAARRGAGVPRASASAVIDEQLSAEDIDRQLLALEAQALQHGAALGAGFSYPVTVEEVGRWSQTLASRGYQLAPASALARK